MSGRGVYSNSGAISTAEYADIYHALLDLALLNSVNEAIIGGRRQGHNGG